MTTLITKDNINQIEVGMQVYCGKTDKYYYVKRNFHVGQLILDLSAHEITKNEDDIIIDNCWYFEPLVSF